MILGGDTAGVARLSPRRPKGLASRRIQLHKLVHMKQNVRQTRSEGCSDMPDVLLFHLFTSFAVVPAPAESPVCILRPVANLTSLDLDGVDVEFAADFGLLTFAPAVRAFKGKQLFFEQLAAAAAAEFRFNFHKFKGGALTRGAFCYDAEVGLHGFPDVAGVISDDHVDLQDAAAAVFAAVFACDFYDLLCDW